MSLSAAISIFGAFGFCWIASARIAVDDFPAVLAGHLLPAFGAVEDDLPVRILLAG